MYGTKRNARVRYPLALVAAALLFEMNYACWLIEMCLREEKALQTE